MGLCISFSQDCSWGQLHVEVKLNGSLWKGQDKVDLSGAPIVQQRQDKNDSDGKPTNNRGVSVIAVDSFFLLSSMDIQSGFPFVYFSTDDLPFSLHRPDWVKDIGICWYFGDGDEWSEAFGDVIIQLFDHGLHDLFTVRLFDEFMIVHCIFV